jgi:hypothetical protein
MLIISFGVLLTVAKETEFNLWGFIFIMLAAVMSGFRWSMTQILLQVCYYITLSEFSYFCSLFLYWLLDRIPGPISFIYLCCIFVSSQP